MASKMRGKTRRIYDLAESPSLRVVKKLCNRGLVSSQYMNSFKEKLGTIKSVINSKPSDVFKDENYWLGK